MAIKRRGKANSAILEGLAEEGDEDAQAIIAEEKKDKALGKAPFKSVAIELLNRHVNAVFAAFEFQPPNAFEVIKDIKETLAGRPRMYEPKYAAMAYVALSTSPCLLSEAGLAARLGIVQSTWATWKQRYPEFAIAVEQGVKMQGDNMGNVGVYDKVNVAGLIMAMKNSAHRWRDKIEHDIGDNMADLIRRAEENKRVATWQDMGAYGDKKAELENSGDKVIDVEVRESVPDGKAESAEE